MQNPLEPFLRQQGFAVLDGGLATEMEARGADLDHFLWSARMLAESPDLVRDVHRAYLDAGADIIATATYQASAGGFARAGFSRADGDRLISESVSLAEAARDAFWTGHGAREGRIRPLVAASVGPYGACLHDGSEYHGNYAIDRPALRDFHRERLDLLAATSADLLAFETIPSQLEAEVLVELLAEYPHCAAWLSFSCRDGKHVSHGERFSDCAALAAASPQVVAVGVNCTPPQFVDELLASASGIGRPLVAYPNSGERWIAEENRWAGESCDRFDVAAWYAHGARLIGGCCRTGPADIRRVRSELFSLVK